MLLGECCHRLRDDSNKYSPRACRYGGKEELDKFLSRYAEVVIMDPLDPPQLDLGCYLYPPERDCITLFRPRRKDGRERTHRGIFLSLGYTFSFRTYLLFPS